MPVADIDSNGIVDNSSYIQIFDNGIAINVLNPSNKLIQTGLNPSWNVSQAVKTDSTYKLLLTGKNVHKGKFVVWSLDSSGVFTESTGWRSGKWMDLNNYDSYFSYSFLASSSNPVDADNNGLLDSVDIYQLVSNESSVVLHDKDGNFFSNRSSSQWDIRKSVNVDDNYHVLVSGTGIQNGKYQVWNVNSSGLVTANSGWRVAPWLSSNGYDSLVSSSLATSSSQIFDSDSNGLVDSVDTYQLYIDSNDFSYIHFDNGRTLSDSTSSNWNITNAVREEDAYHILISGIDDNLGKYMLWEANTYGLVTAKSGWRVGAWLIRKGYDSLFGVDLTNSVLSELPIIQGDANGDKFGRRLDISSDGKRLAVSSPNSNVNGNNSGKVSLYSWSSSTSNWELLGLPITGSSSGDMSGYSVSLTNNGNRVAIGSPFSNSKGIRTGHAQVYDWDGSNWIKYGSQIVGERKADYFGYSIDLSGNGDTLAVGAKMNDGGGYSAGHVRVYKDTGSGWSQIGRDIDGEKGNDYSGSTLSISDDGNTIAIGAFHNSASSIGSATGHTRVYRLIDNSWIQLGRDIDGESRRDSSGSSVDISKDGNRVAIGAILNDGVNGEDSGHVRVFEYSSGVWNQLGADIDGAAAGDHFGYSPKFFDNGNKLIVGARRSDANGENSGQARIFSWNGSDWKQVGKDINGVSPNDYLGQSIGISEDGTRIALGSPSLGNSPGLVRLFKSAPSSLGGIYDDDGDGLVDGSTTYQFFDSGLSVHLHKADGKPISDSSNTNWKVTNAKKVGNEFKALLTGYNDQSSYYMVWTTDSTGLKTSTTGPKLGSWMSSYGYDSLFGVDFNETFPSLLDSDSNGLVDGSAYYHLFNGENSVFLHRSDGRKISDQSSTSWIIRNAKKVGDKFKVLLTGVNDQLTKYSVWETDINGLLLSTTGWKIGSWMQGNGYSEIFGINFIDSSNAFDNDSNGLVDGESNYRLYREGGNAIFIHNNGRYLNDDSSDSWDITKAVFQPSSNNFLVSLSGTSTSRRGLYNLFTVDEYGAILSKSKWRVGSWMSSQYGSEWGFVDEITGVLDNNNDGLVDSVSSYQLFSEGKAVYLHKSNGKALSDRSNGKWDVEQSVKTSSGFKVLLEGQNSKADSYQVWSTNDVGLFTNTTGFRSGSWMAQNSYEAIFGVDFNEDGIYSP